VLTVCGLACWCELTVLRGCGNVCVKGTNNFGFAKQFCRRIIIVNIIIIITITTGTIITQAGLS